MPNPFEQYSPEQRQSIREQLQGALGSGKLTGPQVGGVSRAMQFLAEIDQPATGFEQKTPSAGEFLTEQAGQFAGGVATGVGNMFQRGVTAAQNLVSPAADEQTLAAGAPQVYAFKKLLFDPVVSTAKEAYQRTKTDGLAEGLGVATIGTSATEQAKQGNVAGALGEALTYAAVPKALQAGPRVLAKTAPIREHLAGRIVEKHLQPSPEQLMFGREVGQTVNKYVEPPKVLTGTEGWFKNIDAKLKETGGKIGETLSQPGAQGKRGDLKAITRSAVRETMAAATEMKTKRALGRMLRDWERNELPKFQGADGLSSLQQIHRWRTKLAREVSKFKEGAVLDPTIQAAKQRVVAKTGSFITEKVPDLKGINNIYSDLASARDAARMRTFKERAGQGPSYDLGKPLSNIPVVTTAGVRSRVAKALVGGGTTPLPLAPNIPYPNIRALLMGTGETTPAAFYATQTPGARQAPRLLEAGPPQAVPWDRRATGYEMPPIQQGGEVVGVPAPYGTATGSRTLPPAGGTGPGPYPLPETYPTDYVTGVPGEYATPVPRPGQLQLSPGTPAPRQMPPPAGIDWEAQVGHESPWSPFNYYPELRKMLDKGKKKK